MSKLTITIENKGTEHNCPQTLTLEYLDVVELSEALDAFSTALDCLGFNSPLAAPLHTRLPKMATILTLEQYSLSGELQDEIFITEDEVFVLLTVFHKEDFTDNDEIVLTPEFSICRYEVKDDK